MSAEVWAGFEPPRDGSVLPGASRGFVRRESLALAALALTFASLLILFAVSPITLAAFGIDYIEGGGSLLAKFHPSTPLALAAAALRCLAARRPLYLAWRLLTADAGVVLLVAAVAIAAVFAALVDKTPVTPLVDTFLLPTLVFVLLRDLEGAPARWLAGLVGALLVANAFIAIGEYLSGVHLVRIAPPPGVSGDPTEANMVFSWTVLLVQDWRAVALLGHPLVNGLVIGSFVICLAAPGSSWIPAALRNPALALAGLSLLTFGARTALVLTLAITAWLLLSRAATAIGRGARLSPAQMAAAVLVAGVVCTCAAALFESGLVDRTLHRFASDDGSATTRITMFALFDSIRWSDLLFSPDRELVATLQRVYGLEFGIESSWIGLVLTYGLVVAAIVAAGFLAFWRSVLLASGRGGLIVFAFYTTLISVSASLSGKDTSLAMVTTLVVLFLRRDTSRRAPRPVKGR